MSLIYHKVSEYYARNKDDHRIAYHLELFEAPLILLCGYVKMIKNKQSEVFL